MSSASDSWAQDFENYTGIPLTSEAWQGINRQNALARAARMERLRALPGAVMEAGRDAKTTVVQELGKAGQTIRALPGAAMEAGRAAKTTVVQELGKAGQSIRALPGAALEAGRTAKTTVVQELGKAGQSIRALPGAALDAGRAATARVGEELGKAGATLRALPEVTLDAMSAAKANLKQAARELPGATQEFVSSGTARLASGGTARTWAELPGAPVRRAEFWGGVKQGLGEGLSSKHLAGSLGFETFKVPLQGPLPEGVAPLERAAPLGRGGKILFSNPEVEGILGRLAPRIPLVLASVFQVVQLAITGAGQSAWTETQQNYCQMISINEAMTQSFNLIALQAGSTGDQATALHSQIDALRAQSQAWQQQMLLKSRAFVVTATQTILLNIVLCLMLAFYLFGKKAKAAAAVARGDAAVATLLKTDPLLAEVAAATVAGR